MAKVSELGPRLIAVRDTLVKVGQETTKTRELVEQLKGQLADADIPPEAEATLAEIETQARTVDEMVPDPEEVPTDPNQPSG